MKKALLIRLDRIGDLVLTLPCDHLLTQNYEVQWVIPSGLRFVIENSLPERKFHVLNKKFNLKNFFTFYNFVRHFKADVSISFHVPWWINFVLWICRVPQRGGVLSQWHSYLFLNKGLRQKRSDVENHEMEYNYLLVENSVDLSTNKNKWLPLKLKNPQVKLPSVVEGSYFVVHPGMGGSALNWPTQHYKTLIENLSTKQKVIITGTQSDEQYLKPLKKELTKNTNVLWLDQQLSGPQLLTLLSNADAILAPSTGVLHLGSSLGAPSLGVYSPVKVHQAKRWGPKGEKATVLSPDVTCPAHFECLKTQCPKFDCMESLTPEQVLNSLAK